VCFFPNPAPSYPGGVSFLDIMQSYFRGERTEALFYILPAGVVLFGLAATALASDRGGFGWGAGRATRPPTTHSSTGVI
jgi:hypothetical protein